MNIKIILIVGFAFILLIFVTANNDDDQYATADSSSEHASTITKQSDLPIVMPQEAKTPSVETTGTPTPEPTSKPEPAPVVVTHASNPQPMPVQQIPVKETVCFFIPDGVQYNGQPPEALRTNCDTGKPLYPQAFDETIRGIQQQMHARQVAAQQQLAAQQQATDGPVFHGGPLDGIPNLSPFPEVAQANYNDSQRGAADRAQERELGSIRRQGMHECRKACIRDARNVSLCTASCGSY